MKYIDGFVEFVGSEVSLKVCAVTPSNFFIDVGARASLRTATYVPASGWIFLTHNLALI